jgi:hypothetical protein
VCRKHSVSEFLVPGVDAMIRDILTLKMQQMANVMKQGGCNQRVGTMCSVGKKCSLQAMLEHSDGLAEIGFAAPVAHQSDDCFGSIQFRFH